jgi:hypothetical protein
LDLFGFVSWVVVLILTVTLLWPINTLLLALAYKVRQGTQPISIEVNELWIRAVFASLALALTSVVMLGLLYGFTQSAQMPAGVVQSVLLAAYLPAAVGLLFWILALEDLLQATSVFMLYILIPGLPLLLIGRLFRLWESLRESAPWLLIHST